VIDGAWIGKPRPQLVSLPVAARGDVGPIAYANVRALVDASVK